MELKPCHRRPLRPDEIGPRVMELSKYLRKNFNAAVAEQGLFSGQQDILLLLIRQPGMTLGQLSRALGVASATASVSVKRMEKAGFIEKRVDEKDARIVRLYPTPVAEDAPKKDSPKNERHGAGAHRRYEPGAGTDFGRPVGACPAKCGQRKPVSVKDREENRKENRMLKKLSKYMKGLWGLAAISAAGMIVEAICELALPSLANSIYQKVDTAASPESVRTAVILSGLGLLALALLGLFGGVVTMKTSANVSQRFAYRLRGDMYRKISHFSFKNIDQFSTASLTTRMTNDVTTLQNVVMMCLRILVRVPALAVVAACFAVSINPRMSAMLLILLPILIVVVACILKFGFPMFQKMQKKIDNVNRVVQENLIGMRVVKAYVREDREKDKFHDASDDLAAQGAKAAGLIVTVMPVMMLMLNAVVVFVYYKGALEANAGVMEVGQISVFASYVIQILMNLMMISMMLLQLARGKACGDRVVEVLDTEIDITNPENPYLPENPQGGVEFRDVSFKYNTEGHGDDILEHISFTAKPGQIIGIVGGTGCGKSSLVNLIPRLYDATQGQVLIDGVDVRKYDLTALREMIGVVLQKECTF